MILDLILIHFFTSKFLLGKNVIIFGVYNSLSVPIDHNKKDIQLIFQDHKDNLVFNIMEVNEMLMLQKFISLNQNLSK